MHSDQIKTRAVERLLVDRKQECYRALMDDNVTVDGIRPHMRNVEIARYTVDRVKNEIWTRNRTIELLRNG